MDLAAAERHLTEHVAGHADVLPYRMQDDLDGWLEQRRQGIGGSDAGTVLGINPYQGRFELWLNKTGVVPDKDLNDVEVVYWGNVLEDIVCREFARRADVPLFDSRGIYRSKTEPWQQLSPDRFCLDPETGAPALFEAKTAGEHMADHWDDGEIPDHYQAQVLHGCAVTGLRSAWIGVLIGGQRYEYRRVEVDEDLLHDITVAERLFWTENVVGGRQPEVDASESCTDLRRTMWTAIDETVELDPLAREVALGYLEAHAEVKAAEQRKAEFGNWLRKELAENSVGTVDGVKVVSHKAAADNRFDVTRFKEEHPALYEQYLISGSTRRLYVPKSIAA